MPPSPHAPAALPPPLRAVHLSLGANLGNRLAALCRAVPALNQPGLAVTRVSPVYETAPMYVTEQPAFLNMAVTVASDLAPAELLERLQRIEQAAGRLRSAERNGPRPLDIDIIAIDDLVRESPELTLPHPRLAERAFVLAPLADIAPCLIVPGQTVAVAELLRHLDDPQPPCRFAAPPAASQAGAAGSGRGTYTIYLRDFCGTLAAAAGGGSPPQLCLQAALTVSHPGPGFPDDIGAVMSYETVVEDLRALCATAPRADAPALAQRAADLCLTWPPVHRVHIQAKIVFPTPPLGFLAGCNEAELTLSHPQ